MSEREVPISPELLERVLASVTPETVLVGGQALAVWVGYYGIDFARQPAIGAISDDADLLGCRDDVDSIARSVHGRAEYPPQRAITALIGQVRIRLSATEFVNVDVIDKVVGIPADEVRERASEARLRDTVFLVMHPLDVLLSRVENLARLEAKRNPEGVEQVHLALAVARAYVTEIAGVEPGQRRALNAIERIVSVARSSAGRAVCRDFGISFLAAIPVDAIESPAFHAERWPRLQAELAVSGGTP